jgi:hypothetical protein
MRLTILAPLLLASLSRLLAELPDIRSIPLDLTVPAVETGAPAAGKRVAQTTTGWSGTEVHHTLYLPANWTAKTLSPLLVEYPGNGGYRNQFGDECDGTPEGCKLGFGLSAGRDYLWVCLPFVETATGKRNALKWWGDEAESARYAIETVQEVCAKYGGDPRRVVLMGFSRGAIACNHLGLRDDAIASLWCGMLCHSHYDGVRRWPYPGSDRAAALARLQRLRGRPQFISHEGGTADTEAYLKSTGLTAPFTFVDFPYRNHTDTWALRDCELRRRARAWLHEIAPPS